MAQTLFDLLGDPEAAAFAPAFAKDKRRKPSNIDVLNAGIAGIGDLAYDAAGFPVDLSAGLMRALGFDVGQTPMGSDWLKSKATSAGIRPPESADPTLRDVRLGAEMMSGGIDPFATAKGIGIAGSAIAREAAPIVGRGLENYANKAGLNMNMLPPEAAAKVMGQTKIVDEAGLPELYYRGAKSKYEPLSSAGVNAASKSGDIGLWMSKSPDLASSYTGSQGLGHVSPAYPDVRNPLVIDAGKNLWSEIPSKAVEDVLGVKLSSPTVTTDQVARIAKDRGFDGVQFKNVIDVKGGRMATEASMQPTDVLVAFNPKAVRSALSDKAIAGVARVPPRPKAPVQQAVQKPMVMAPVSESGFYSAVEQAALNLEKTDGTGQGLLNELMKAPDVKKDEMDAIGLIDAFKDKPKATKQELIDYIGQNKIELGSTVRQDYEVPKVNLQRLDADLGKKIKSPSEEMTDGVWDFSFKDPAIGEKISYKAYRIPSYNGMGGVRVPERVDLYDGRGNLVDEFATVQDAQRYVENDAIVTARHEYGPTRPKFRDYALDDGKNYQETLLTLPMAERKYVYDVFDSRTQKSKQFATRAEAENFANQDKTGNTFVSEMQVGKEDYISGHWEQPNVMAHVRTQDFVDADGKNMRVIEEVQSDWHQAGREKGYGNKLKERYSFNELPDGRIELLDEGRLVSTSRNMDDAVQEAKAVDGYDYGVPDAPMKETWYQTALRKAVKDAIDAGQDRVGITTGARQAERYNLRKQVDGVFYTKNDDGTFNVSVAKNDKEVWADTSIKPEKLSDVIGKELTKKIVDGSGANENGVKALRGLELEIGGEGMKKYYDDVYPKYLEKFAKKYGATVKEVNVKVGDEWPFPIEVSSDGNQYWLYGRDPRADGVQRNLSKKFDNLGDAYKARDEIYDGYHEPVRYIEITPEMRKAFGGKDKGVPLFQAAPLIPVGIGAGGLLDQFGERQQ